MYFDTHVHFDGITASDGPDAAIERALAAGVTRMTAIGGDAMRNRFAVDLAERHPGKIHAAVGYDRDCAGGDCEVGELESLMAGRDCVVAVGEIGLDLHYHPENRPAQRELLARMLEVARRHRLPVAVHSRDAEDDTVDLLAAHHQAWDGAPDRIGVLHCFTGDTRFVERLLDLGLYISFSGIVTFRNADSLRSAAAMVPDERLLMETDTPYLAPVPHRGKLNEPASIHHIAETLATVRGVDAASIAETTFKNAERLFGRE